LIHVESTDGNIGNLHPIRLDNKIGSLAGFRKAHMRAFVYSSCHVYCNKMRTYALYGIQLLLRDFPTIINIRKIGKNINSDYILY